LIDLIAEFHIGFIAAYDIRRLLVLRRGQVAENYIRRGGFVVDILSSMLIACVVIRCWGWCAPPRLLAVRSLVLLYCTSRFIYYCFDIPYTCLLFAVIAIVPEIVASVVPSASGQAYKILFFFRLLRLLRVVRLLRGSSGIAFLSSPISTHVLSLMNTATFFLLNILFTMLIFINLLGCIWWFVAVIEGLPNSWVPYASVNFDLEDASKPSQYVTSIYFAMTVITTVGFGDITPQTVAEMIVAVIFMACAVFYFGYIVNAVSQISTMISSKARGAAAVREKLEEVDIWTSVRLPSLINCLALVRSLYGS